MGLCYFKRFKVTCVLYSNDTFTFTSHSGCRSNSRTWVTSLVSTYFRWGSTMRVPVHIKYTFWNIVLQNVHHLQVIDVIYLTSWYNELPSNIGQILLKELKCWFDPLGPEFSTNLTNKDNLNTHLVYTCKKLLHTIRKVLKTKLIIVNLKIL